MNRMVGPTRSAALGLLTAAVSGLVMAGAATPALADTTVSGAEYEVHFDGTASEDVVNGYEQKGSWTLADDDPGQGQTLWLPKAPSASLPDVLGGFDESGPDSTQDPGAVTETWSGTNPYTCSWSQVEESGFAATVAQYVPLGSSLAIATDYDGFPNDGFPTNPRSLSPVGGNPTQFNCSGRVEMVTPNGNYSFPPVQDRQTGGTIAYHATIPWSEIGQQSFSLPATDDSTVSQASWWTDNGYTSVAFHLSGSYTFQKLCDGTISYPTSVGTCGASNPGPNPGPGPGQNPGPGPGSNPGPGPSPGAAGSRPNTKITKHAVNKRKHTATVRFAAIGTASGFQCALVRHVKHKPAKPRYSSCRPPKAYRHLTHGGRYTFYVRALDAAGADTTPANWSFRS